MTEQDHVSAQYPDAAFFAYRERFVQHLIDDLTGRCAERAVSCLDVGSNNGRYTAMLAEAGLRAQGIDFESAMVTEARARYPELTFEQGDAQDLPYPDASFDVVVSLGLIQCVPDWRRVMREICRVLKPGGVALVETNRAFPVWEALAKACVFALERRMTPREVSGWLRAHLQSGEGLDNAGLRKFRPKDLLREVAGCVGGRVVLHDPKKHGCFHDFVWAVTIQKGLGGPDKTTCRTCRSGIGDLTTEVGGGLEGE